MTEKPFIVERWYSEDLNGDKNCYHKDFETFEQAKGWYDQCSAYRETELKKKILYRNPKTGREYEIPPALPRVWVDWMIQLAEATKEEE